MREMAEEVTVAEASRDRGGILVFLKGQKLIEDTAEGLQKKLLDWTVLQMYSKALPA